MRARAAAALVATAIGLGASACGGGSGPADPAVVDAGSRVFAEAGCKSCHTLSAAGASGRIGPSLDETQLDREAIAEQVTNGGNGMPQFSDRLSDEEIEAVGAYVAEVSKR